LYRNEKLTPLIIVQSLDLLADEILEAFATAEAELAAKAEEFQRGDLPRTS
jgi:hypothetical protein